MKKLRGSFAAKLIAVVLLCVMVAVFGASFIAAAMIYEWGGYSKGYDESLREAIQGEAVNELYTVANRYQNGNLPEDPGRTNLRYRITDGSGKELYSCYDGGETLWEGMIQREPDYSLSVYDETVELAQPTPDPAAARRPSAVTPAEVTPTLTPMSTPEPTESLYESRTVWEVTEWVTDQTHRFESEEAFRAWLKDWQKENRLVVQGYVLQDLPEPDAYRTLAGNYARAYELRYPLIAAAALSFLLGVLLFIFLLSAAGHRDASDAVTPGFVEKVPFDLLTALIAGGICLCFVPIAAGFDLNAPVLVMCLFFLMLAGLLFLLWCMSFAVRVKLGTLLSSCLCVRLVRWLWRTAARLLRSLPLIWKTALSLGLLALIDWAWQMGTRHSSGSTTAFGWFVHWAVLGGAIVYAALAFRRLRLGAKEIASGKQDFNVETKGLIWDFKDHAEDLNHIRGGLNAAVEERVKSERFRTELITNVSHDIKTPLTSIVNYVDLLAKEEPESETQREYIAVLSRQSAKLKKLIEDLIEASKASTGSLPVTLQPVELGVLLDQTAGEYAEKLENAGLKLVLDKPEAPVTIRADGRHMWRIFDNLMSNIVKYAMPGTRVYLSLRQQAGKAEVTFRNISREPLRLDAAELTERFVRGDAARSSEGSGLGLSIAMSLAKLQQGQMDLTVDGDLFKVTLQFNTAE